MTRPDTRQAEKDYLTRTGSSEWERTKPFSPPHSDTLEESAHLLHDFSAAMLTLRPSPDDLILDLGAGAGWCSDLLGRLNRSSVAVDLSFDMLRAGRGRQGAPVRAVAGDMEALPFRTGTFDKAVCFSALHHVPDMSRAVGEISRVLAPDGVALFSEPGEGHDEAAVSAAAMRDFGVLEQEVIIETFIGDCRKAGFEDVRVKPLAYTIPGFDLTLDQWQSWMRVAESTRPRRALAKMGLAIMEAFGFGKRGALFEDTFSISLVRTLRQVVRHHPIIVASKRARPSGSDQAVWRAEIALEPSAPAAKPGATLAVVARITNRGTAIWSPSSLSGVGHVAVGVQLLDRDGRLLVRDHYRQPLPHVVRPGEAFGVTLACPAPSEPGAYQFKIDLVAEGVTWFEAAGSTAPALPVEVL
ncbi:MAG TPA: class I SAM-dependent methyltransferase [Vicinamibacterales bacterium]|jgi:SAM-dependent methyltransferase|nr:class I SAM-dependent methyltransferase [Vicinamibacterales bacterium]